MAAKPRGSLIQQTTCLLAVLFSVLSPGCSSIEEKPMTTPPLAINVTCKDNDECLFRGEDIYLDIDISNKHDTRIGVPLAFIQKTGPVVRLLDSRSGKESYVPKKLASFDLKNEITWIEPGQSVQLAYMVSSNELRQFDTRYVNVELEVTVMLECQIDGTATDFVGLDSLRITGETSVGGN